MNKLLKTLLIMIVFIFMIFLIIYNLVFTNAYSEPVGNDLTNFDYYNEIAQSINIRSRELVVDEVLINKELQKTLENENNFSFETSIFGKSFNLKVDHLRVRITEENIVLFGNLNLNDKHISGIRFIFELSTDNENINIHLSKVKIGKLPVMPSLFIKLVESELQFEVKKNTIILPKQYINDKISEKLFFSVIVIDDLTLDTDKIRVSFEFNI